LVNLGVNYIFARSKKDERNHDVLFLSKNEGYGLFYKGLKPKKIQ